MFNLVAEINNILTVSHQQNDSNWNDFKHIPFPLAHIWDKTIKDDIPYVLEYIDTARRYGEEFDYYSIADNAYKKWHKYRDSINYQKRAEELKDDPFYAPYCKE